MFFRDWTISDNDSSIQPLTVQPGAVRNWMVGACGLNNGLTALPRCSE